SKAYVINSTRRTHRQVEEKLSLRHVDLAKAQAILSEIRAYLQGCPDIDSTQKVLVNIEVIAQGTVDIRLRALSYIIDETQFLMFRDALFLKVASIINAHDAELALPVQIVLNVDKNDDKRTAK